MMLSWIIIALLWLAHSTASEECPSGERWTACVGACTDCWRRGRCEQPFCEPGCDCLPGRFRDDWGECVPASWCPSDEECGTNEEYSDCAVPCNTCEQRGDCDYICLPGCDCRHGFKRDSHGTCVTEDHCPYSACPTNEGWVECARPAWCATCEMRGHCGLANCTRGCDCLSGYYRNHEQTCVPEYKCPQTDRCPPDEQYYSCMPDCTHRCKPDRVCTAVCRSGCFCRPGLVRREDGRCVRRNQCAPSSCDRDDEEYYSCKPFCTGVCGHRGACPLVCIPGCFCKQGLLLRNDGACVPQALCTSVIPTSFNFTTTSMPDYLIARRLGGDIDDVNVTSIANSSVSTTGSTMSTTDILTLLSAPNSTVSPPANSSTSTIGSTGSTSSNASLPVTGSTASPSSNVSLSATESSNSSTSTTSPSPSENTNVTASNSSMSSTESTTTNTSMPVTQSTEAMVTNASMPTTESPMTNASSPVTLGASPVMGTTPSASPTRDESSSTTPVPVPDNSSPVTLGASPALETTPSASPSSPITPVPVADNNLSTTQLATTNQTPSTPIGGGAQNLTTPTG